MGHMFGVSFPGRSCFQNQSHGCDCLEYFTPATIRESYPRTKFAELPRGALPALA